MSNQPVRPTKREPQRERLEPFFRGCRAVVVVMERDETEAQAWQRYVKKHPQDLHADIRIFHIC
jgi:predicted TIM-barrel fold metal-dependent hydrolase